MVDEKGDAQGKENIYDQIPYPSVSHSLSHPDRLATVATLLGMEPVPVERCRVLELGCASGGNLIPMAQALPESHFIGLDLAQKQVAEGAVVIADLGLSNISLIQKDILAVTPDLGQFDYIIAHGVYSWVPVIVREKLFDICHHNLTANGVAYISYNTYPGWNMLGTLREMMRFHTRNISDPHRQATEARDLLDFLAESVSTDSNSHGGFLYVYTNYIKDFFVPKDDAFLLHDELADINDPVYFHEFIEQASRHDLKYLGDVSFSSMLASNFPADVAESLRRMAKNTVELEQYMDFLRNRMFRQSLLCHRNVSLSPRLKPERLSRFYMASVALPESAEPDVRSVSVETFQTPDGAKISTDHPLTKAAMLYLIEIWPQVSGFDELVAVAAERLRQPITEGDRHLLGANLLKAYGYSENLVEFHLYASPIVTTISEQPLVSQLVRYQAANGYKITNLRHERIVLDEISTDLLTYLDGQHDHSMLIDILRKKDVIEILQKDGQPVKDEAAIYRALNEIVQKKLKQFAQAALLIG